MATYAGRFELVLPRPTVNRRAVVHFPVGHGHDDVVLQLLSRRGVEAAQPVAAWPKVARQNRPRRAADGAVGVVKRGTRAGESRPRASGTCTSNLVVVLRDVGEGRPAGENRSSRVGSARSTSRGAFRTSRSDSCR